MSRRSIDQILEGKPYKKLLLPEKLQQSEIDLVDTDSRKTQYYVRIYWIIVEELIPKKLKSILEQVDIKHWG